MGTDSSAVKPVPIARTAIIRKHDVGTHRQMLKMFGCLEMGMGALDGQYAIMHEGLSVFSVCQVTGRTCPL